MNKTICETFLFIIRDMQIGGIETCMARFVYWLIKHDYRVIFIGGEKAIIDPIYHSILYNKCVEIVECDFSKLNWLQNKKLSFRNGEKIVAYAFSMSYYVMLEDLRQEYKQADFHTFFWLAHYKGYFIEEDFPFFFKYLMKPLARSFVYELEKNNNIIYLHERHMKPFTEHYNYKIVSNGLKYAKYPQTYPAFDEHVIHERFHSDYFTIITVARISFPHKGYMMGLVKAFANLKAFYPKLRLWIVGDGPNRTDLENLIESLDRDISKDIRILGFLSDEQIENTCRNVNLNLSLAGGVGACAKYGVLSIPVRHSEIEYSCEVYDYLPLSKEKTVSTEPGEPVEEKIIEVMNLSYNNYLQKCLDSYNTYKIEDEQIDKEYAKQMDNTNVNCKKTSPYIFRHIIRFSYLIVKKIHLPHKYRF